MPKHVAYSGTTTSPARSRERIEGLLIKYGASRFSFDTDLERERAIVKFRYEGKPILLELNIRAYANVLLKAEPWSSRRHSKRTDYESGIAQKALRGIWRAAETWLKAMFEAIEFGLLNFETAFMPHFGHELPNGEIVTIARIVLPQLESFAQTGKLLPAPEGK